ncbi:MAG: hypothetical protein RIS76_4456 [Verrucomicrobiota bacterium]|jgi:uroporphyrinogen decarboxylase
MPTACDHFLRRCSPNAGGSRPWALWRHYPLEEYTEPGFVEATVRFHQERDFALWKIGPRSSYAIRDHGARDEFRGDLLGRPAYLNRVVLDPSDWHRLQVLYPRAGWQGQILKSAAAIAAAAPANVPVLMTMFSPMTQAKNLCGAEALADHWRHARADLQHGLAILTESTRLFVRALRALPISGLFYAIQECGDPVLGPGYAETCADLDTSLLQENGYPLNLIHLHGAIADFDSFTRYPAAVLHWDECASGISLEAGADRFGGIVAGGIPWPEPGAPDPVTQLQTRRETLRNRMSHRRFLLSASCVIPWQATDTEIAACRP